MKLLIIAAFLFLCHGIHAADDKTAIVIFGASGDLVSRKLVPALYHLDQEGKLPDNTTIVGFARRPESDASFRNLMESTIQAHDKKLWPAFASKLFYCQSAFEDDYGYKNLNQLLGDSNRIYYLATPPKSFLTIIQKLQEHGLLYGPDDEHYSRVIIEKPFGHDLPSAQKLQQEIGEILHENQIYLMDHYLGKEGVQNLFSLRFENAIFESIWNNQHIESVQITLSEDIGIGTRGKFWEETGLLRDVVQNHVMQILALAAMERPAALDSKSIQKEKIAVLNAIKPIPVENMVRGQYTAGTVNGISVPGYLQEAGVSEDSTVETFVALKLFIDKPRWQGVPFYIRAGKRLPKQTTEILVTFKNATTLLIPIQPLLTKQVSDAYAKLLHDSIKGIRHSYVHPEEQLAAWRILTPLLNDSKIEPYEAGSWGPQKNLLENKY